MRAEKLGKQILVQTKVTWDEHEADNSERVASIYWLGQLLRSRYLKDVEIDLPGNNVSLLEIANAINAIDTTKIPMHWRYIIPMSVRFFRKPNLTSDLKQLRVNLDEEYPEDMYFPPALE